MIAILDDAGATVVEYTYDAWGNILSTSGSLSDTLGKTNPLRYRGYVYDEETGLYYLQSRYYAPQMGRFINADALIATGQGLLGNNMYAYCNNNPVCYEDPAGTICMICISDDVSYFMNPPWKERSGAGRRSIHVESDLAIYRSSFEPTGTLAVGVVYEAFAGGGGASYSAGLVGDIKGNIGGMVSGGFGGGFPSEGLSGFISITNAPDCYALKGPSGVVGGSVNILGISIGIEYYAFNSQGNAYHGLTLSIGAEAALPVSVHGYASYSEVIAFNLWKAVDDFFHWVGGTV